MKNSNFIEQTITVKDIQKDSKFDSILLENNEKQIEQISEFLENDKKLLLLNGFRGSGKTQIINYVCANLNPDVITLNYTCFETTIIDDLLLSFFDNFKYYVVSGKITLPKTKVDNFTQKINSYFNFIKKPILIIIDSFQSVLKENKSAILDFVKHLSKFSNIKVVLVSNVFNINEFTDISYENVTILALNIKLYDKLLKERGIKNIGVISNELYKLTKGYYNTVILATNIINLRKINLVKFLEQYSKSYMALPEYIIRESLELVDPVSIHLFRLLTVMRIPIHINLLKYLHLYDEERIEFFTENSILSQHGNCIYLKDYFRDIIENQIPDNVRIKLHSACVDLYNTQLPLKPLERDLMLSRQTMRNEIEYHSLFIPKKPLLSNPQSREISIEPTVLQLTSDNIPEPLVINEQEKTKEEKLNQISFIVEDEAVLDDIADSIKNYIHTSSHEKQIEKASLSMSLLQLMNQAKKEEADYNYKNAIKLYNQALTKTTENDFYTYLPIIYTKLAQNYKNISDWYEALEYYTQAQDFYVNVSNSLKVAQIKLEIANLYYIMYKHDNARFILSELEKTPDMPPELQIKINLTAAKLSEKIEDEFNYYKKSIPLVDLNTDKTIISELYYKYATAADQMDDIRLAAQFYKKCISQTNNNPYISKAMMNLAQLYDEQGDVQHAIKYYKESMELDKASKNYNGLYYSSIHLGEIFSSSNENLTLKYFNDALNYAQKLNDPFYIAQIHLELGDFYIQKHKNELAYQNFLKALNIGKKSFTKENLEKVELRFKDMQKSLSKEQYEKLQEKYGK